MSLGEPVTFGNYKGKNNYAVDLANPWETVSPCEEVICSSHCELGVECKTLQLLA